MWCMKICMPKQRQPMRISKILLMLFLDSHTFKIAQDKKIALLLPELPLIMGGHEHTSRSVSVGNTVITKADANAKTVYVHRISYDKKTKKARIVSELKAINSKIKTDVKVGAIVAQWQKSIESKNQRNCFKSDSGYLYG